MQKALLKLGIWLLTAWLIVSRLGWANTIGPQLSWEKISQGKETLPVIEAPLSGLEERLFADAADGRLNEFSLFEAALIASGVDNRAAIGRYQERVAGWAKELRQSGCLDCAPQQQIEAIFEYLHRKILYHGYDIQCTDLRQAMDEGRFNCVSSSVLFNCMASELGFTCCGLETPGHAMSRVFLQDGPLDLETTCPRWLQLKHDPVKQAEAVEKTIGNKAVQDKTKLREVTPIKLAAMIYYNRGVQFLAEKRFSEAVAANAKAFRLDPLNNTAWGNFLAAINNWAIELGNTGQFAQAVALLKSGMVYDPHYEAFAINFVHVHHQWSEHLCKENRYQEAAELLNRAAKEMPDQEYFKRALWEVYGRWAVGSRQ